MDTPITRYLWNALTGLILTLSLGIVVLQLLHDLDLGGDDWRQADWMINYAAGIVRRGFSGEFFITVSETMGVSVLAAVVTAQILIIAAIFLCLMYVVVRRPIGFLEFAILASPLGFQFWAIDPAGVGRKEILVILPMLILAAAAASSAARPLALVLSVAIFLVSILFHEGNFFALPAYVACLYFYTGQNARSSSFRRVAALATGGAVALFAVAALFSHIDDTSAICAAYDDLELSGDFCMGAIGSLEDRGGLWLVQMTVTRFLSLSGLTLVFGIVTLFILPLAFGLFEIRDGRQIFLVFLLAGLSFLPLYLVANDWGRWLNMGFMSGTALFFLREQSVSTEPVRTFIIGRVYVLATVLLLGIQHVTVDPIVRPLSLFSAQLDAP